MNFNLARLPSTLVIRQGLPAAWFFSDKARDWISCPNYIMSQMLRCQHPCTVGVRRGPAAGSCSSLAPSQG